MLFDSENRSTADTHSATDLPRVPTCVCDRQRIFVLEVVSVWSPGKSFVLLRPINISVCFENKTTDRGRLFFGVVPTLRRLTKTERKQHFFVY